MFIRNIIFYKKQLEVLTHKQILLSYHSCDKILLEPVTNYQSRRYKGRQDITLLAKDVIWTSIQCHLTLWTSDGRQNNVVCLLGQTRHDCLFYGQ